jgi:hypothetical protein
MGAADGDDLLREFISFTRRRLAGTQPMTEGERLERAFLAGGIALLTMSTIVGLLWAVGHFVSPTAGHWATGLCFGAVIVGGMMFMAWFFPGMDESAILPAFAVAPLSKQDAVSAIQKALDCDTSRAMGRLTLYVQHGLIASHDDGTFTLTLRGATMLYDVEQGFATRIATLRSLTRRLRKPKPCP